MVAQAAVCFGHYHAGVFSQAHSSYMLGSVAPFLSRQVQALVPKQLLRSGVHMRALLWREVAAITRNPADVAGV